MMWIGRLALSACLGLSNSIAATAATTIAGEYWYDTPRDCRSGYGGYYNECPDGYRDPTGGYPRRGYYYPYYPPDGYYGPSYQDGYIQGFEQGYQFRQDNPPNTNRRNKFR